MTETQNSKLHGTTYETINDECKNVLSPDHINFVFSYDYTFILLKSTSKLILWNKHAANNWKLDLSTGVY